MWKDKSLKIKQKESNMKLVSKPFFSTNNVLIHQIKNRTGKNADIDVYLPGYMRVFFKNFIGINLINLTSLININIIFNIYYGDLF